MSSFANLKRNKGSNIEKLTKAVEAMNSGSYDNDDDEYWKCEVDKAGNGFAIFRFLPAPQQDGEEALPWVKYYDHGFQGPGGWYIEKSLTTIGKEDPASIYNSELWATGLESNKEIARKQKRRLHYVSNIYIIKDSKNPDNEGKVFKFRFGKKIFEKITQAMNPQFEDDKAIDPFDLWEGANFKLKIRKVDGYQNYDLSEFESPSPLFNDDKKLEEIWKSEYSLLEIIDEKNFKSFEVLKARLDKVLGITSASIPRENTSTALKNQKIQNEERKLEGHSEEENDPPFNMDSSDDSSDGDFDYFNSLVEEE